VINENWLPAMKPADCQYSPGDLTVSAFGLIWAKVRDSTPAGRPLVGVDDHVVAVLLPDLGDLRIEQISYKGQSRQPRPF
jgi:hypothetical protein